jgi:hypothetical protein
MAAAELSDPLAALSEAIRASEEMSAKRGNAIADKMPKITITTTSSIKVKPDCLGFISIS